MKVMGHLLSKEFMEMRRTWRLWTIGGVLLVFGVLSPVAALLTPALVSSVVASQPGIVLEIPDPTYVDAYAQWIKNLSQIGLFLVVFASAGLISNERSSGTAVLVVAKPVSRRAFAIAKYAAQAGLVIGATALGTAVTAAGTFIGFGEAPLERLVAASALWALGALLAVALAEALSAALPTIAAGITALVVLGLAGAAGLWEPAARYTPVGLLSAPNTALAGEPLALAWPVVTTAALIVALVALAGALFSRREL